MWTVYRNLAAVVSCRSSQHRVSRCCYTGPVIQLRSQEQPVVFAEGENCPRGGPWVGAATIPGQPASAPSLAMSEKAVTAHRDITALFSLLSCPLVSVTALPPERFRLPPCPTFYSGFFFPFCSLGFIHCPFFSLSLSLAFFLSLFGSLSFCMLYTTPPRKGTCLIPYHCWSRNLWKESWSWWTTCQALCAIIMPSQLPNITTLRTRLIFLISCKVSIQTWFDWDL